MSWIQDFFKLGLRSSSTESEKGLERNSISPPFVEIYISFGSSLVYHAYCILVITLTKPQKSINFKYETNNKLRRKDGKQYARLGAERFDIYLASSNTKLRLALTISDYAINQNENTIKKFKIVKMKNMPVLCIR
jgi:hypothetical protein